MSAKPTLLFVVNVDWFFLSHRLPIALAAIKRGYEVHIATGLTNKKNELEAYGIIVHPLNLTRSSTGILGNLKTFFQILKLFRSLKPNLIHLVTIKPVLLGGIAAHLSPPTSLVVAISGLGTVFIAKGWKAKFRLLLVRMLYRVALSHNKLTAIFQNASDQNQICCVSKLPPNKSVLIPGSGVDLSHYLYQPIAEGKPLVMLAARLLKDKGVIEFIDAIELLRERETALFQSARFVLVGDPDAENHKSINPGQLRKWQQEGIVEWWGHRSNMSEILPQAHICVLPSYREGLPKVLAEAAACGRAIITTDVPGCRDAIVNGKTGILIPPRNSAALSQAIRDLLREPDRYIEMGATGRRFAQETFSIQNVVEKHLTIYEDSLAR
jgi:glycosyltransferase involved in cell wall biosynthesis